VQGTYLYDDWDPALIERLLRDSLTPSNARIDLTTCTFDAIKQRCLQVGGSQQGLGSCLSVRPSSLSIACLRGLVCLSCRWERASAASVCLSTDAGASLGALSHENIHPGAFVCPATDKIMVSK
jgi:hypothetical protein